MLTCGCSCCLAAVGWCQVNDLHSSSHTDAVVSYSVSAFFSENKYSLNWLKSRLKMWVGPNLCPSVPFVAVLQVVEWRSRRKSLTRYECVHFIPWLTSYSPVRFVPAALPCSALLELKLSQWVEGQVSAPSGPACVRVWQILSDYENLPRPERSPLSGCSTQGVRRWRPIFSYVGLDSGPVIHLY